MYIKTYRCMLKEANVIECNIDTITNSSDAINILNDLIAGATEEYAYVIMLNVKGNIIGVSEVSHGDLSGTMMNPREVYKRALAHNAAAIIVAHNHPSGSAKPSMEDKMTTKRIEEAGQIIGIKMIDHIIIGNEEAYSFGTNSLIKSNGTHIYLSQDICEVGGN